MCVMDAHGLPGVACRNMTQQTPASAVREGVQSPLYAYDRQLAQLRESHPGWHIWYVPHASGGATWCAWREPHLEERSPADLGQPSAEALAEEP